MSRVQQSKYSTGQKRYGGNEYDEFIVRDNRGLIVGYALLDPRDQNAREEYENTQREFEQDFGR